MVQINYAQKQVSAKIVYYGPGMSGKTTNLEVVHQRAPEQNRGELTSISTDGDRTLFFDFMPLDLGTVAGMRTCFQIYTVPGQVYYNSTRKLVLQGVDGVVFVADSAASMLQENLDSLRNLEENLNEYGKSLATVPYVLQLNKRDLPDALPVEELVRHLNPYGAPCFEAIANTGQGVFPTLKALAARVIESIHSGPGGGGAAHRGPAPMGQAPQPAARAPVSANAPPVAALPRTPIPAPTPATATGYAQPLTRTGFQPHLQAPVAFTPAVAPTAQTVSYPPAQMQPPAQAMHAPPVAGPLELAQAPLIQTGFHAPSPSAATNVHAPHAHGAMPQVPAQAPLQLAVRGVAPSAPSSASPLGSADPAYRTARPPAQGSAARAARAVPSPLEGTRFRPRGQPGAQRHEPLPTPATKSGNKTSAVLFVAAAVAVGAALTFVAVALF